MSLDKGSLITDSLQKGATCAGIIDVSQIAFSQELRNLCKQNACGKYGTNWMCPPGVGELEPLKARVSEYKKGLVVQTVHKIIDSFDFEGMMDAGKVHNEIFRNIVSKIKEQYMKDEILILSAGACDICPKCTYIDGKECRFPEKAIPSIESYGINVAALVQSCDIPYTNGPNTVSYVGLILFKEDLA